jgi:hypothetical protein
LWDVEVEGDEDVAALIGGGREMCSKQPVVKSFADCVGVEREEDEERKGKSTQTYTYHKTEETLKTPPLMTKQNQLLTCTSLYQAG